MILSDISEEQNDLIVFFPSSLSDFSGVVSPPQLILISFTWMYFYLFHFSALGSSAFSFMCCIPVGKQRSLKARPKLAALSVLSRLHRIAFPV